jgi:hypothetical protein
MRTPRPDSHLDPLDRLFIAIVRQAITDYQAGRRKRKPLPEHEYSFDAARAFLEDLGLLTATGDVARTEQSLV